MNSLLLKFKTSFVNLGNNCMKMIRCVTAIALLAVVLWDTADVSPNPSSPTHAGVLLVTAFAPTSVSSTHSSNRRHVRVIDNSFLPTKPSTIVSSPKGATTTRLESAKVLPYLYNGLAGALLYKLRAVTQTTDKIVLWALAVLSLFSFGQSDNAKLKSAKLACKKTMAISADTGKEEPSSEAMAWQSAVRYKILFQVLGMLRTILAKDSNGLLRGAGFVLGGNLLFLLSGGESRFYHDSNGVCKPRKLPERKVTFLLMSVVTLAAIYRRS